MTDIHILDGRSVAEAHLYMDIRGCAPGRRGHRLEQRHGQLVSIYECQMPDGTAYMFMFRVLADPLSVEGFGNADPSRIIGPGEFLLHAEALTRQVPASPVGLSGHQIRRARLWIDRAVRCVEEVLKFIPEGEDVVPAVAFRSVRGAQAFQVSPGRFGRFGQLRLHAILSTYRSIAAEFACAALD